MSKRKNIVILTGLVLAVSLFAVSITTMLLTDYYNHAHVQVLGGICQRIIENQPEAEQAILEALKEYKYDPVIPSEENMILKYGYRQSDFWKSAEKYSTLFAVVGFLAGALLFLIKNADRISGKSKYRERRCPSLGW